MLAIMGLDPRANHEPALLDFDTVSFVGLDGATILEGVTLGILEGQVSVVAGPSGAGKSTLLRLGNRLEVPTAGAVRFRGEDLGLSDPRVLRRNVGMVFQKPIPFAGTVRSNLKVAEPSRE